jgi:alpha-L-fucosidase
MYNVRVFCLWLVLLFPCCVFCQSNLVVNGGFEDTVKMMGWQAADNGAAINPTTSHSGTQSLQLGSGSGARLKIKLQPLSTYKLRAWVKTSSGSGEIQVRTSGLGPHNISLASALADWVEISQDFATGMNDKEATLEIYHPATPNSTLAWADDIVISRTGDYKEPVESGILPQPDRVPRKEQGIMQLANHKMDWLLDARLGMFIHWGPYAGPAKGEWYMENNGVAPEEYRKLLYPSSGEEYFVADSADADAWAKLASDAGMKYMCMVTMHHDGYAMFNSQYMDAFSSRQTHNRDFVREYVDACRKHNLKVGLYKTLINWRYPGYYDVTGTHAAKNKFGYTTQAWHKENARLMKEGLYADTKQLLTSYGKIDYMFWDGGWLGQQGSDAAAAYFWESGKYLDKDNAWPLNDYFKDYDTASGMPLGLMGMVRKYQPDMMVNARSGWYGDYMSQEGGAAITGPIRNEEVWEKCMSLGNSWGYNPRMDNPSKITSLAALKRMLADCIIRNMALLLNVGPDRHGVISKAQQNVLLALGGWATQNGPAVYGTRAGPWQPKDGMYGYAYKGNTIYLFLLAGFKETSFTLPAVNAGQKLVRAYRLANKEAIKAVQGKNREITLQLEKKDMVADLIAIELSKPVYEVKNR